jgi:hypothetical protein
VRDLESIELTESITGEAIMPRDVDASDHQPGEVAAPHPDRGALGAVIMTAHEKNECLPLMEASAILRSEWLRKHDAEVAAKALEEHRRIVSRWYANANYAVPIGNVLGDLTERAARIRREAS